MKNINLKRSIGLLSFLLMIPVWVCAQNITVKGTEKIPAAKACRV